MKLVKDVVVKVSHFYHGGRNNRSYGERQYILLSQFPMDGRLITCDKQGLLSWNSTKHYAYRILSNLHTINNDPDKAHALLKEHIDYLKFKKNLTWVL